MLVHLSTADVPERDRIAITREVYGRIAARLDFEPVPGVPLQCEITVRAVPGLVVSKFAISPMTVRRTRALTADGNDSVVIAVPQCADFFISHQGRERVTRAGEAVVLSAAEPATCVRVAMSRCLNVSVPRRVLTARVPALDDAFMRPIPTDSEALRLLTGYIEILEKGPELTSPELCHAVVDDVHDLLALVLGASRDAAAIANGRGVRAARLRALKADIFDALGARGLSIAALARRHGVSPRYVQKLFESEGTTFSKFLLDQRLARVHRMLTSPRFHGLSISAIAFEGGFSDLSHFNRNFRRRYGESPSDVRAAAMRDGTI
jgi:AraC-like DNA-binding protein